MTALAKLTAWLMTLAWLSVVVAGIVCGVSVAQAAEPDVAAIVEAIYWAEGGPKTRHPFGILSVKCEGYAECKRICRNTVRNNVRRWKQAGMREDYLEFLARRYAPTQGATNDPSGLNRHWLKNVRFFLAKR